jgi:hypothetical protein
MKKYYWPILINGVAVLLLLAINYFTTNPKENNFFGRFAFSGLMILLLAFINFIAGMVRNRNRTGDGEYYLLASGLLLLIGFSVCTIR